jgi:hypothetical protein
MTASEILGAFEAAMKALGGVVDLITSHEKKIAVLEAQIQAHDKQLATAPEPGPILKGN